MQRTVSARKLKTLKAKAIEEIESNCKFTRVMVDKIFSLRVG
jgi:hypothetical protein